MIPIGSLAPIGSVIAYMGTPSSLAGTGWIVCDGSDVDKTVFGLLFNLIGYTYGGSGSTFAVPNLSGQFLRGVDNGASPVDPDRDSRTPVSGSTARAPGSTQMDMYGAHTHNLYQGYHGIDGDGSDHQCVSSDEGFGQPSTSSGGTETRPKNVYVYWIIKGA